MENYFKLFNYLIWVTVKLTSISTLKNISINWDRTTQKLSMWKRIARSIKKARKIWQNKWLRRNPSSSQFHPTHILSLKTIINLKKGQQNSQPNTRPQWTSPLLLSSTKIWPRLPSSMLMPLSPNFHNRNWRLSNPKCRVKFFQITTRFWDKKQP